MLERPQRCICITIAIFAVLILSAVLAVQMTIHSPRNLKERLENFERHRQYIFKRERYQHLGGTLQLSAKEVFVNDFIVNERFIDRHALMRAERSMDANETFGKQHLYDKIQSHSLFGLIKMLPKGAALHVNLLAMCSIDCLLEFTYHEYLWSCVTATDGSFDFWQLLFSNDKPSSIPAIHDGNSCEWISLQALRTQKSPVVIDARLLEVFNARYSNSHEFVLSRVQRLVMGLITYEPIFTKYILKSLQDFHQDNVQYIEIHSALPNLYNLKSRSFTFLDTAHKLYKSIKLFCTQNTDFYESKLVYKTSAELININYDEFLERAYWLKRIYPDFLAGIDISDNTKLSKSLQELSIELLPLQEKLNFFYYFENTDGGLRHTIDSNLISSVLLGSKRITENPALSRHPELLRYMYRAKVAVEVSPTAILQRSTSAHLATLRDHSSAHLFAVGYPLIVTTVYPAFVNVTPLTHDFYLTFVGICTENVNLGVLKRLAWNSIQHSSMNYKDKQKLSYEWLQKWNAWIDEIRRSA